MHFVKPFLAILGCLSSARAANNVTNLTVALVRAPPPDWPLPIFEYNWGTIQPSLNTSIDAGIRYMQQAKSAGADWIVFPELWFPG